MINHLSSPTQTITTHLFQIHITRGFDGKIETFFEGGRGIFNGGNTHIYIYIYTKLELSAAGISVVVLILSSGSLSSEKFLFTKAIHTTLCLGFRLQLEYIVEVL